MLRTLGRAGAALALSAAIAFGAATVAAAPAQAGERGCADGNFCFWMHSNFSGSKGQVSGTNGDWQLFQGGCTEPDRRHWNNCASSIRNEGRYCEAVIWSEAYYTGGSWVINRDTEVANLSNHGNPAGGTWNDTISSNSWWCG
jgi:hypothetical protein